nr:hypothetical protein [Tanacetum cinerariifolium]
MRDDIVVKAATTATSLEAEQESGNINKTRSTTTLNESSPQGTGSGSGPRCQDTTFEDTKSQTRFETASKQSHDPPLLEFNTFRNGEDNCSRLGDQKATKESQKIRKEAKAKNSKDESLQDCAASSSVTTAGVSISTVKPSTPPTTITTVFEDKDLTIAQTIVKMRSEKAKEKGVSFRDVKEFARPVKILPTIDPKDKGKGIMQEPEKPPKNLRMDSIQLDKELAKRMYEEEMDELEKGKVNSFVLMDSEVVKDSRKKDDKNGKQAGSKKKRAGLKLKPKSPKKLKVMKEQESTEDDQEIKELRLCLNIAQDEDRAINYETLDMKSLIVDWETQLLGSDLQGKDLSYWKITRVDGSFRFYKVFSTMLEEFDRQDLFDLHRLVMKRFKSVALEGYDLII